MDCKEGGEALEHLVENSLEPNEKNAASVSNGAKRQPLASVHYGSLKKTQLRQLCAKYGLSTSGSENDLKERHMEFVTLHNADSDATCPRSYSELAEEVGRRDMSRKVRLCECGYNSVEQVI
jgi:hypothetical protein